MMKKVRSEGAKGRSGRQKGKRKTGEVLSQYFKHVTDLRIDMIDEDMVLIEAHAATFRFLSELFRAAAEDETDCGTQFFPHGPFGQMFSKKSRFGLYLHRLPCMNHAATGEDRVQE
jgi:hypothetical protein